jgi:predicted nuclease of predicted toxin-antitoxin system
LKLLLDQNVSHRLLTSLIAPFPGSTHVRFLGLEAASDAEIWNHAQQNGFVIVTRDADFVDQFVWHGGPPSVVWLNCGNSSTASITALLLRNVDRIRALEREDGCLTIEDEV